MVKVMAIMDRVTLPERCDAAERLHILHRSGCLPQNVADALPPAPQGPQQGGHEGYAAPAEKALALTEITCSLCVWFYQTYADEHFRPSLFSKPECAETSAPSTSSSSQTASVNSESAEASESSESEDKRIMEQAGDPCRLNTRRQRRDPPHPC